MVLGVLIVRVLDTQLDSRLYFHTQPRHFEAQPGPTCISLRRRPASLRSYSRVCRWVSACLSHCLGSSTILHHPPGYSLSHINTQRLGRYIFDNNIELDQPEDTIDVRWRPIYTIKRPRDRAREGKRGQEGLDRSTTHYSTRWEQSLALAHIHNHLQSPNLHHKLPLDHSFTLLHSTTTTTSTTSTSTTTTTTTTTATLHTSPPPLLSPRRRKRPSSPALRAVFRLSSPYPDTRQLLVLVLVLTSALFSASDTPTSHSPLPLALHHNHPASTSPVRPLLYKHGRLIQHIHSFRLYPFETKT